jgi:hypothetical protein
MRSHRASKPNGQPTANPTRIGVLSKVAERRIRARETSHASRVILGAAFLTHFAAAALALTCHLYDLMAPTHIYAAIAVVQLLTLWNLARRCNYLTCVLGGCLTSILAVAILTEWSPILPFDSYLPANVYDPVLIRGAFAVLTSASSLFYLVTTITTPRAPWQWAPSTGAERYVSSRLLWPAVIVSTVLYTLTFGGLSITQAVYATAEQHSTAGLLSDEVGSGFQLLGAYLICFALVSASRYAGHMSARYVVIVVWSIATIIIFRLLRGARSDTVVVAVTIILLFAQQSSWRRWTKNVVVGAVVLTLLIEFQVWGSVRQNAAALGLARAVSAGVQEQVDLLSAGAFTPLDVTLLPAAYWQLLHCIDLYEAGFGLEGSSFTDLAAQTVPSFVARWLDFDRPLNVSWRLAEHRLNGGGLFLIAEGYWNLGMLGALLISCILAFVATTAEHWFRRQEPLVASAYFAFVGTFGFGMFYTFQTFARALEVAVLVALFYAGVLRYTQRRYSLHGYRQRESLVFGTTQVVRPLRAP